MTAAAQPALVTRRCPGGLDSGSKPSPARRATGPAPVVMLELASITALCLDGGALFQRQSNRGAPFRGPLDPSGSPLAAAAVWASRRVLDPGQPLKSASTFVFRSRDRPRFLQVRQVARFSTLCTSLRCARLESSARAGGNVLLRGGSRSRAVPGRQSRLHPDEYRDQKRARGAIHRAYLRSLRAKGSMRPVSRPSRISQLRSPCNDGRDARAKLKVELV